MEQVGIVPGVAVLLLLVLLASLGLMVTNRHRDLMQIQLRIFLVAVGVRFAASLALYLLGIADVIGDADAGSWILGVYIWEEWLLEGVSALEVPARMAVSFDTHHQGYRYLLAGLFYFTDSPYRMVAAALNCVLGGMTVIFVVRTARVLFSDRVGVRVGWLCCLMPSLILWSAVTAKEPVVIFLESVALYACVRLQQDGVSVRHLLLAAVATVLLLPFRFYAAAIVAAVLLLSLLLPGLMRLRTGLAALCLAALLIPGLFGAGTLARHEAEIARFDVERVEKLRHRFATGHGSGSGVVSNFDMNTPTGFTLAILQGGAHLLLAPFPWQLMEGGSQRMMLTAGELVLWWYLFFAGTLPGLWYCLRHRLVALIPMLLFMGGFGLLYSATFGNIGLVYRQRAQLLPWLLILAAVGLDHAYRTVKARPRARVSAVPAPART